MPLLVVPAAPASTDALETAFRHMGLRPEIVAASGDAAPRFRLHLGALNVLVGRAEPPQLVLADPDNRVTSLLGAITEMQVSGMPPVLHLIAFRHRDGVGGERVATRGLTAFAGQELEAMIPAGWDMAAMVKRLARLALDMMVNGPLTRAQQAPGLNSGEWVALTPQVEFSVDR